MKRTAKGLNRRLGCIGLQVSCAIFVLASMGNTQPLNRVQYQSKDVFLSGINVAWVNFAGDLGPNPPDTTQFRSIFQQVRNSGGNSLRIWLNTNGSNTPSYDSQGYVDGPGPVAIRNLREILSLAERYKVGLILCLWSFDMLKSSGLDSARLYANRMMLTDTVFTMAYVRNSLIPMVDSVKSSPAVLAWEVCNEANGMTEGINYSGVGTVPGEAIQQFTNLIAGGIHRADPSALVTTGPGSFQTLTNVNPSASARKGNLETVSSLSPVQLQKMAREFNAAHRLTLTQEEMQGYLKRIAAVPNRNYYSDSNLVAAGGDSLGTLNFYTVHYYYYNSGSTLLSPFTHPFSYWALNKPTAVAEFYMQNTEQTPDTLLISTLYDAGYAGGLVWSYTDFPQTPNNPNAERDTWIALSRMWHSHRQDVDVFGADWPLISIVSPAKGASYPDSTQLVLTAAVLDTGSTISSVKFFVSDSLIGEVTVPSDTVSDTLFFSFEWKDIPPGMYSISASATNSQLQEDWSEIVSFSVGKLPMTPLSVGQAAVSGPDMTLKSDPTVPGGHYLDIRTNDMNATVTWTFTNQVDAGSYPISFGVKLAYASPKAQLIKVNGEGTDTVTFEGTASQWIEKTIEVNLVHGSNTVQMQMFWGWLYLGYLSVPSEVVTSVESGNNLPTRYSLGQNYPNPFNPSTKIEFALPSAQRVSLTVYDVLGQQVRVIVDRKMGPGTHIVDFSGSGLSSGVYFYRLVAGDYILTRKMMLLK